MAAIDARQKHRLSSDLRFDENGKSSLSMSAETHSVSRQTRQK